MRAAFVCRVLFGCHGALLIACAEPEDPFRCAELEGASEVGRRIDWRYAGPLQAGDEAPVLVVEPVQWSASDIAYRGVVIACAFGVPEVAATIDDWAAEVVDQSFSEEYFVGNDLTLRFARSSGTLRGETRYPPTPPPEDATQDDIGPSAARAQADALVHRLEELGVVGEGAYLLDSVIAKETVESDSGDEWLSEYSFASPPIATSFVDDVVLFVTLGADARVREIRITDRHIDLERMATLAHGEAEAKAAVDAYLAEDPFPPTVDEEGFAFVRPPDTAGTVWEPYWLTLATVEMSQRIAVLFSLLDPDAMPDERRIGP